MFTSSGLAKAICVHSRLCGPVGRGLGGGPKEYSYHLNRHIDKNPSRYIQISLTQTLALVVWSYTAWSLPKHTTA